MAVIIKINISGQSVVIKINISGLSVIMNSFHQHKQ